MKKNIKVTVLKEINIEDLDLNSSMYNNTINRDRINSVLNYKVDEKYKEDKIKAKNEIIKALKECDDFEFSIISNDRFGNEYYLKTYKIDVESDEDFNIRKEDKKKKSSENNKKRKEKIAEKEKLEYERLKKKFEDSK